MIPTAWKTLINTLTQKTMQGKVDWAVTDDPTLFEVEVDGKAVTLDVYNSAGNLQAVVTLMDKEGEEVDSFTLPASDPDFQSVRQLWAAARNKAKGIDTQLSAVVEKLSQL